MDNGIMDLAAYAQLKEILGDTLQEVIKMYISTMPEMLDALDTQIQEKNANQVFEISHRIKSSSSSIAAMGIANVAEKIEHSAREASIESAGLLATQLRALFTALMPFLSNEIRD